MKKLCFLIMLGMLCGLAGLAQAAPTKIILNTYGGAYQSFFEKEVIPEFNKKYDADVQLAVGLAKDWTAEIRASGFDRAPYDLIMLNEIWSSQMRREGYFAPLREDKIPNLKNVIFKFKVGEEVMGAIGAIQPVGLAYRTDKMSNPPKSWKALWDPQYKNKIGLCTITNTLGALFVMATADAFYGDPDKLEEGILKIKELKPFKQTDFSGDMEKLLAMGEIEVGMLDSAAVARLRKQGLPLGWNPAEESLVMMEQVFSIHKGSKVQPLAENLLNFLLSPEIQTKFVEAFYASPATFGVSIPEHLKADIPIDVDGVRTIPVWDWNMFNDNKTTYIRLWNQHINR